MPNRCKLHCFTKYAFYAIVTVWFVVTFIIVYFQTRPEITDEVIPRELVESDQKYTSRVNQKSFLVILLLSAPGNVVQRDAIRSTWLQAPPRNVRIFFSVGMLGLAADIRASIQEEDAKHGDLMLLDIHDVYRNLTRKLLDSFLQLDRDGVNFEFLFKGDDDTFVRVDALLGDLRTMSKRSLLYWGFFDGRARVKKTGEWAERQWVLCDRYLPHARGGGYVLAARLVTYIVQNNELLQRFNSEDVSVGAWLGPLRVDRLHDPRFDTEYISRGCNDAYIVTHKQTAAMMEAKWASLTTTGRLCPPGGVVKLRLSYEYNWDVPPSLCCVRNNSDVP